MDPRPELLQSEYRLRFSETAVYRNNLWTILCRDFFSQFVAPNMAVLDLGCGWGEFINNINAARKLAMDLNPDARSRLADGIQFLHQDCSEKWQIAAGSLDVVFTSNFLEHLPSKALIERAMSEAWRCLKPGGAIVCLGPNVRFLPGAYWDFWDHQIPLTECSLAELLRLRGFRIQQQVPRFLPYSMSTGITPPLFLVRWYLKLPVLWPLFGKQFLVVGQKPAREPPTRAADASPNL